MDTPTMHRKVQAIAAAVNKLMTDLEAEISAAAEQARVDAERSAAVEQAKRELLAEQAAAEKEKAAK